MTYICPAWELAADTSFKTAEPAKRGSLAQLVTFRGTNQLVNCMSRFLVPCFTISLKGYVGNKQKSHPITRLKMCATMKDAKPSAQNIRFLNWAAVERATIQVSELAVVAKAKYDRI